MAPKEAALKAMREISGPVIGIALVLSAVFVPTAFIPGITGRMYQQFAVTIAISVILSAFNALTLSPALAALMLRPRVEAAGCSALLRLVQPRVRPRHQRVCPLVGRAHPQERCRAVVLVVFGVAAGFVGKKVPSSFLPDEDQGYIYVHLQLPNASSLQRTDEVSRKVEDILAKTPGVKYTTSVVGFSLLSFVRTRTTASSSSP